MTYMWTHQRVWIRLLFQRQGVEKPLLIHLLVSVSSHHDGLNHRKTGERFFNQGGVSTGRFRVDHVEDDVVARKAGGVVNTGFQLLIPIGSLCADIEIRRRQHDGRHNVVRKHRDAV